MWHWLTTNTELNTHPKQAKSPEAPEKVGAGCRGSSEHLEGHTGNKTHWSCAWGLGFKGNRVPVSPTLPHPRSPSRSRPGQEGLCRPPWLLPALDPGREARGSSRNPGSLPQVPPGPGCLTLYPVCPARGRCWRVGGGRALCWLRPLTSPRARTAEMLSLQVTHPPGLPRSDRQVGGLCHQWAGHGEQSAVVMSAGWPQSEGLV